MNCTKRMKKKEEENNDNDEQQLGQILILPSTSYFVLFSSLVSLCRLNTKSFFLLFFPFFLRHYAAPHREEEENSDYYSYHTTPFFCQSSLRQTLGSMTLTEQPSTRMVVFQNVVFKNDNGCDNDNGTISVELPIKAQRVSRPSVLVRLTKRFSNLSHSTAPIDHHPPQPNTFVSPPILSIERQNSSESDLSLSKLDITDEYSGVGGNESLNTSRQTSELDLTGRKSSFPTSQKFTQSFRNFYSRFSQKHLSNTNIINNTSSSTIDSNTRLTRHFPTSNRPSFFDHRFFSCCFSKRNESPTDVPTSHHRFFIF